MCRKLVKRIRQIYDSKSGEKPKIDFHYLLPGTEKNSSCRCVKNSIGILPDGRAIACFWAVKEGGVLCDDKFLLGDVTKQPLTEILESENARYWRGYCAGHTECAFHHLGK
ncbi:MAG: SPASM domain-containing protein [Planctomycetaceae bacterium]|jgi:hypothetical protein|nr:SPASM domain-containing protein [Planctomycetaceae bacterium]